MDNCVKCELTGIPSIQPARTEVKKADGRKAPELSRQCRKGRSFEEDSADDDHEISHRVEVGEQRLVIKFAPL